MEEVEMLRAEVQALRERIEVMEAAAAAKAAEPIRVNVCTDGQGHLLTKLHPHESIVDLIKTRRDRTR